MHILDLVFPKWCVGCGRIGSYICRACALLVCTYSETECICPVCERAAIDGFTHPTCRTRYGLDGCTSFFRYEGVVKQGIKKIKYQFVSDCAQSFVDIIPGESLQRMRSLFSMTSHNLQQEGREGKVVLVPIPLHKVRKNFRGFNQAELLGRLIANQLHIPVLTDILMRTKKTTPQVEMRHKEDRLRNMQGVFAMNPSTIQQYNNTAILLFDDVFTTGATMRSACMTLKRAGVPFVWAVSLAR